MVVGPAPADGDRWVPGSARRPLNEAGPEAEPNGGRVDRSSPPDWGRFGSFPRPSAAPWRLNGGSSSSAPTRSPTVTSEGSPAGAASGRGGGPGAAGTGGGTARPGNGGSSSSAPMRSPTVTREGSPAGAAATGRGGGQGAGPTARGTGAARPRPPCARRR